MTKVSVYSMTDLQKIFLFSDKIIVGRGRYHNSSPIKMMPMTQILLEDRQPSALSLYIIREVARQYNECSRKSRSKLLAFNATMFHAN